jgi:M6 family metalloprotease-like protein
MKYIALFLILAWPLFLSPAQQNRGELANLVCFVRFADESESVFDRTIDYYEQLFNSRDAASASVYSYFLQASYGQLKWNSVMYPAASGTAVVSYKAANARSYYLHRTDSNLDGYDAGNAAEALLREQNLVKEIADYMDAIIPESVDLDKNSDGVVDNITLIVSGNSEISSRYMLWPHRSTMYIRQGSINDKKVSEYILLFAGANGWSSLSPIALNTGVLCHEMSHTLGTRDLYHNRKGLNPVGVWDLMSDNLLIPQGMSAYTKFRYCKWIDSIPEISAPGVYTLNPVGGASKENIACKIKPAGSEEYFVLEYRRREGTFESGLPASGLLIYRISPDFTGNENYDGITRFDEQYLFRKGGTVDSDGDISRAAFSRESGRTAFGGSSGEKPFYTDGREAQFAIGNVSACGETISFELLPFATQILPSRPAIALNGNQGSSTSLRISATGTSWQVKSCPGWLEVTPASGAAGNSNMTLTAKSRNMQAQPREGTLVVENVSSHSICATVEIAQKSDILQPPSGLKAEEDNGKVRLTWKKSLEGSAVLSEDFENTGSQDSWIFKTENSVGWVWQPTEKYKLPYEGDCSARLNTEMQDRHQDEWLISPVFSGGTALTLYSSSIAPGKNNPNAFYLIKASSDGGASWNVVYDLKTQGTAVNKYEFIEADLTPYRSENMRLAFHAFDTDSTGLPYWWHVDNIVAYAAPAQSAVKEYRVFRNGEEAGRTTTNAFIDNNPVSGENLYRVKAVSSLGETPFSNFATIGVHPSAIKNVSADGAIQVRLSDSYIHIESDGDLLSVLLYGINGNAVYREELKSNVYKIPTAALSPGIYILRMFRENKAPVSCKIPVK